jgi:alkanesulfonate monooxygenase
MCKQRINGALEVFSTCPQSADGDRKDYLDRVIAAAQWSEDYGCKGTLVYSDNRLVDPWFVSQVIVENTATLCPLVAVQPLYMHPYTVAKLVASFAFCYGRRIYLNMVAGGFKNDLTALKDATPHDSRYDRLREYTQIIKDLLPGGPVNFEGEYYQVANLKLTPPLAPDLFPGIFLSGSSDAGLDACRSLGATAIKYPKSPKEEIESNGDNGAINCGIRVGIIAREEEEEAWAVAHQRFPEDRKGQLTHQLAMKVSDSLWHKQLSHLAEDTRAERSPYWLTPFENYKTFCPYLVGSYQGVARELAKYIGAGYWTFILDIPPHREEMRHTALAFHQALPSSVR